MDRGLLLKQLREAKRLSQTDAARHIGVSKQTLYKYENNIITNIPSDIIERIAVLYETTPAYLMGWEDEQSQKTAFGRYRDYRELYKRLDNYDPEQVIRALDFLDAFQNASPESREAVAILLKSRRRGS